MDLTHYRQSQTERQRNEALSQMLPPSGVFALDVGARDGFFSFILAERFESVVALDLAPLLISHARVLCIQGDVTALPFAADAFDVTVCTEVLEHIAPNLLPRACAELTRVTRGHLLVGVPYNQDIRVGRTTCLQCGACNPPWGHVNTFDEARLRQMFGGMVVKDIWYVGVNADSTNFVSTYLMDKAGNPYGTYGQEERCIKCGAPLQAPAWRTLTQKVLTKAAFLSRSATQRFRRPQPNWVHMLLGKSGSPDVSGRP